MNVLVLGGTGVMGMPLVEILSEDPHNQVFVVSRHAKVSKNNVHNIVGNAFDLCFLKVILKRKYDAIVDFLWYDEITLPKSLPFLLSATNQYISLSSAAVYIDSDQLIDEDVPRIIDIEGNEVCSVNHEYHLTKAKTEDIVKKSSFRNWTIVRPHVTFNVSRIPFCTWEMNVWLFRFLNNLPLAVPKDCLDKKTTLTFGYQVASQIKNLIGKKEALGEIFQLGSEDIYTWGEILAIYKKSLSEKGYTIRTVETTSSRISKELPFMESRFKYDRLLNRTFSTKKYQNITGDNLVYPKLEEVIKLCFNQIHLSEKLNWQDAILNAKHDRVIGTVMPLSLLDFIGKYTYLLVRIGVNQSFVMLPIKIAKRIKRLMSK